MSQQSFPGLCLPLLLTTISERSMANCPQTHSGFCIIFRTTDWRGGPDHTHNTPSQSKGLYGGSFLMPVWIQGGFLVPNFPIRELPFIQRLFAVFKCSLSSVSVTSSTNSSPSGGRTDACQTGDPLPTPYMNALTLRKPLVPFPQTLHSQGWHFTSSSVVILNSPWCNKYFCLRHVKSPGISLPKFMQRFSSKSMAVLPFLAACIGGCVGALHTQNKALIKN